MIFRYTLEMDANTIVIDIIASVLSGGAVSFIVATLRIGEYKNKVDTLIRDVSDLEQQARNLSTELTKCSTKLDERTRSYSSTLTKVESPVSLSQAGQALLSRSGADKFVLENKDDLVNKIHDKNPRSAYDVQKFAREVIEEIQDEGRFKQFKDFVYKEGTDLEPIFIVMSIYLRDIALPLLGYRLEEVDHTDPVNVVNG